MILAALASLVIMAEAPPLGIDMPPGSIDLSCPMKDLAIIEIGPDGSLSMEKKTVERRKLVDAVWSKLRAKDCGTRVYLVPDTSTPYSAVLDLMWMLRAGGIERVGLVDMSEAEPPP